MKTPENHLVDSTPGTADQHQRNTPGTTGQNQNDRPDPTTGATNQRRNDDLDADLGRLEPNEIEREEYEREKEREDRDREEQLDDEIDQSFPASDPSSLTQPHNEE